LGSLRFRFNDAASTRDAVAPITALLRERHQIANGQPNDFSIADSPAGQAMFNQITEMFTLLLPIVVGVIFLISLLIIAALMLIQVKERTAEIGLRKAVGAQQGDIEQQFLLETLLIALSGGVLGNALSYAVLGYIHNFFRNSGSDASFLPTPDLLLLSFGCAALTGVLAAWLPARRAAALSPVVALR
ncbi:MAG: FtsX-like permease family protein, partial [Pseudomonadota bacterium]